MNVHVDRASPLLGPADAVAPAGPGTGDIVTDLSHPWRRRLRRARERSTERMGPIWRRREIGAAATIASVATWAAVAAWWTPRGPLTTSEAIASIGLALGVGLGVGFITRHRWTMLAAPALFAVVFELLRVGTDGPTVDGFRASTYGIIALLLGRGFHALVALLPLAFGASLGAAAARQLSAPRVDDADGARWRRTTRRGIAVVAGLGLVAFVAALARPASTDSIVDADGNEVPGSVAEIDTVDIGGHDLSMLIRGHSVDNPVLLFLAGGPGGSEFGAMRRHLPELEEHFTVVTWDQRGAGTSYDELDPTGTLTLAGAVDDTLELTNHLRGRFGQDRIHLLGQSWGTTLGVLAVQEQPELYASFTGTGQMVSQLATDRIFYEDTLEWARAEGNDGLVDELESIGLPPYDDMLDYETALSNEMQVYAYDHSDNSEGEGQMSENLLVEEYALIDQVHVLPAFIDTFAVLYPQLQEIDFRETATEFDIPMFFVQGANEADGRAEIFDDWYPMVDAPVKDLLILETSGHRPLWEQPDEFVDYMVDVVLERTTDR